MKYGKMDWNTMEAVVNRLGGISGVKRFLRGDGQPGSEFLRAMESAGYGEADNARLLEDGLLATLLPVVRGEAVVAQGHVIDCDTDPFLPQGWQGVEFHRKHGQLLWQPEKVALWLAPEQQCGGTIVGTDLRGQLREQPVLNACVLDYLLANPHLIPDSWKNKWVYFWGTVYRDSDGNLFVRCLVWGGDRWRWRYDWLDDHFGSHDPAALCK